MPFGRARSGATRTGLSVFPLGVLFVREMLLRIAAPSSFLGQGPIRATSFARTKIRLSIAALFSSHRRREKSEMDRKEQPSLRSML